MNSSGIINGHLLRITMGDVAETYNTGKKCLKRILEEYDKMYEMEDEGAIELIDVLLEPTKHKFLSSNVVKLIFSILELPSLEYPPGFKLSDLRDCYHMSDYLFKESLLTISEDIQKTLHYRIKLFPFQVKAIVEDFGPPPKPFSTKLTEMEKHWICASHDRYQRILGL